MDTIKTLLYYDTIKLVTVTNWQLGLLHKVIQIVILLYIFVYAIGINQGYQKTSDVEGVLYTKVKGVAWDPDDYVYDSTDVVIPPIESSALFVITSFLETYQTAGSLCPDPAAKCTSNADCQTGALTSFGRVQPSCDTASSRCIIKGWCPVENETLATTKLIGMQNWTVYLRTHVTYPVFKLDANNADQAKLGYNIFSLETMLGENQNWTEIIANGAIVNVVIDWSCNLDKGVSNCRPKFTFHKVDSGAGASSGYNFRLASYTDSTPQQRTLSKNYGIRFIFQITGTGRKFDIAATIVTIGSGVALISVAAIITDMIIQYFHPHKEEYLKVKRQPVYLDGVADDKDNYIKA